MGDKTGIEWTDMTWNPVRGCSRVSEGCRHCYAEQQAARIIRMGKGKPTPYDGLVKTVGGEARWTGVVRMVEDRLADPLKWRKPRRIFANSMSDLFHEELNDEQIDRVFAVMLLAPRHTFQVLTKRAARMRAYFADPDLYERVLHAADEFRRRWPRLNGIGIADPATSPARWIWLGVSVENQAAADERIPELLATPAAVRFLSCEPLLGRVLLDNGSNSWLTCTGPSKTDDEAECCESRHVNGWCFRGIDWVIAGCESGPGARPCDVAWLRSLRDQCLAAGTKFFLKQAMYTPNEWVPGLSSTLVIGAGDGSHRKPGGLIGSPYLDGVKHNAMPEVG